VKIFKLVELWSNKPLSATNYDVVTKQRSNLNWPHRAAQFFVRHLRIAFLLPPHRRDHIRLHETKHSHLAVLPLYQGRTVFRVEEDIADELPQMNRLPNCKIKKTKFQFVKMFTIDAKSSRSHEKAENQFEKNFFVYKS